jgi:N-acetylmuramoyl-L-alanine amidase
MTKGKYHWAIDMGHGPRQAGKRSPMLPHPYVGQFLEYEFNRLVALGIHEQLLALGIRCSIIADSVKENLTSSLQLRVNRFNQIAEPVQEKVLLSIHANAFGNGASWTAPRGIEVWHRAGANAVEVEMAQVFQQHIVKQTGFRDRGIKSSASFFLHKHAKGAAVILTENGFYSNLEEVKIMVTSTFADAVIQAHVEAIKKIEAV